MPFKDKAVFREYQRQRRINKRAELSAYFREYYLKNRERRLAQMTLAYRENPEAKHRYDKERRERMGDILRKQARLKNAAQCGSVYAMWSRAKKRAKVRGVAFTISIADIVIPTHCPALGVKLHSPNKRGGHRESASLDRINPLLGYVPGNIAVISRLANTIKTDASAEQVFMVAKWMKKLRTANSAIADGLTP